MKKVEAWLFQEQAKRFFPLLASIASFFLDSYGLFLSIRQDRWGFAFAFFSAGVLVLAALIGAYLLTFRRKIYYKVRGVKEVFNFFSSAEVEHRRKLKILLKRDDLRSLYLPITNWGDGSESVRRVQIYEQEHQEWKEIRGARQTVWRGRKMVAIPLEDVNPEYREISIEIISVIKDGFPNEERESLEIAVPSEADHFQVEFKMPSRYFTDISNPCIKWTLWIPGSDQPENHGEISGYLQGDSYKFATDLSNILDKYPAAGHLLLGFDWWWKNDDFSLKNNEILKE